LHGQSLLCERTSPNLTQGHSKARGFHDRPTVTQQIFAKCLPGAGSTWDGALLLGLMVQKGTEPSIQEDIACSLCYKLRYLTLPTRGDIGADYLRVSIWKMLSLLKAHPQLHGCAAEGTLSPPYSHGKALNPGGGVFREREAATCKSGREALTRGPCWHPDL
jgi:hypothetical protein